MPAFPNFVSQTYTHPFKEVSVQECINLHPVASQDRLVYDTVPGLRRLATLGAGPHRAAFYHEGRAFAISGTGFYEVMADWTWVRHGTVADDGYPAVIDSNGDGGLQLFMAVGRRLYTFRLDTGVFAEVTDPDAPTHPVMVRFLDGYAIASQADSAIFQFSALEDATDWDPLDIAQKSKTADRVRSLYVDHGELWLMGPKSIEPWTNTGDADTPFQPIASAIMQEGLAAAWSVASLDNSLAWIAENKDGARWASRAQGYTPQRISTDAVEAAWSQYRTVADARAWSYRERGQYFYVVTFPTAGETWVYDQTTSLWHKRLHWNPTTGLYEAYLGATHMYAFERHLVGSRRDGALYEQTFDAHAFDEGPRRWLCRAPHVADPDGKWVVHHHFGLHATTGIGLVSGQGHDPQVALQWSDDGGYTYGAEEWRSLGARGQFDASVDWFNLGGTLGLKGRVYQVHSAEPVPVGLVGATLEASVGAF